MAWRFSSVRWGLSKVGVAGIATLPSVLEGLRERKIIRERLETLPFERNRYFARLGVDDRLGRTLATRPDSLVALTAYPPEFRRQMG
jgi:hypothetical protein